MPDTSEMIAAIRAGCEVARIHLRCTYPDCSCKSTPTIARAAIAAYEAARPLPAPPEDGNAG